ncbi:hypothetical protein DFQ01_11118 [Paenibacillus cellulosilyticus]|uniref:Uncharacterized protein n=1 Tax=Paenibacillus cellulosilyticus TaxID=375489 RepID=A0A2V2YRZ4_9BACL|nr:hypothetical protein [Paenibacillus cellulosilyticus]PWW00873.1 hypothetical protein DFQ01_11118 [Paenibacillus cellulosilyticus]QKS47534.1 hypothetical protein HUB94_24440 [Paenibacillus cellulosilyticus]
MKLKKILISTALSSAVLVVGAATAFAAVSYSYEFEISYQVFGSNSHALTNSSTSTTVKADSYDFYDWIITTKDNYKVEIEKGLTSYSTSNILADGISYTKNFGVVSAGSYTVNVYKVGGNADHIEGKGTINQ